MASWILTNIPVRHAATPTLLKLALSNSLKLASRAAPGANETRRVKDLKAQIENAEKARKVRQARRKKKPATTGPSQQEATPGRPRRQATQGLSQQEASPRHHQQQPAQGTSQPGGPGLPEERLTKEAVLKGLGDMGQYMGLGAGPAPKASSTAVDYSAGNIWGIKHQSRTDMIAAGIAAGGLTSGLAPGAAGPSGAPDTPESNTTVGGPSNTGLAPGAAGPSGAPNTPASNAAVRQEQTSSLSLTDLPSPRFEGGSDVTMGNTSQPATVESGQPSEASHLQGSKRKATDDDTGEEPSVSKKPKVAASNPASMMSGGLQSTSTEPTSMGSEGMGPSAYHTPRRSQRNLETRMSSYSSGNSGDEPETGSPTGSGRGSRGKGRVKGKGRDRRRSGSGGGGAGRGRGKGSASPM